MNWHPFPVSVAGALAGAALLLSTTTQGQSSSASYQIPRQSIDGGAGRTTSASHALEGSIGQPDARATLSSASYSVRGGFHLAAAGEPLPDPLFSNGFETP